MYKTDCIGDIENDFQETLAKCRVVTRETIRNEAIGYKVGGALLNCTADITEVTGAYLRKTF